MRYENRYLKVVTDYNAEYVKTVLPDNCDFTLLERLIEKNNELNDALFELKNGSSPMAELLTRRNNLQNIIHAEQDNCLSDIAFDNERIIALIKAAINYGRIYVNPLDKNKIIIETYNKELGRPTFQCEISMLKMLDFISTNNSLLEEERVVFK